MRPESAAEDCLWMLAWILHDRTDHDPARPHSNGPVEIYNVLMAAGVVVQDHIALTSQFTQTFANWREILGRDVVTTQED